MTSIFTKIIDGEIPCHAVYEDESTFAFLDINPARPGHTLVVPRSEVPYLFDLEPQDYESLWQAVKVVASALKTTTKCERVFVVVYGADVPHAHVHLIPLERGASIPFPEPMPASPEELAAMAERIRAGFADA